jgi:transposase
MYTTILTLYKQGVSQRQIAKTTNTHRKTVKKIIARWKCNTDSVMQRLEQYPSIYAANHCCV